MTPPNVITLKITEDYTLSLVQCFSATGFYKEYAEVALQHELDGVWAAFVPPADWCLEWVGEDYSDDVIAGCDAHDLGDLISYAKQYVYQTEKVDA